MPKQEFIGDQEKSDVHAELVVNKQIIKDNLTPIGAGGNWPDISSLPVAGRDAINILRDNQIIFANALIYMYKRINEIDRVIGQKK